MNALKLEEPFRKIYFKKMNQEESTILWLQEPISLKRKGSRLMSENKIWYMHNIRQIPSPTSSVHEEYYQIETHLGEELVVYQKQGIRGFKEVILVAVKSASAMII